MRNLFPAYLSILVLAACAAQSPPPPTPGAALANPALTPASYALGSATNTTAAFDGTYTFTAVRNLSSGGGSLRPAGEGYACPDYTASPLIISNGLAQFDVANTIRFQGYVTPQGSLAMRTGVGQTFEGQVDRQGVITATVTGGCGYEASWRRSA
jgi:hypothetical protein